jgi:hypothetical protein
LAAAGQLQNGQDDVNLFSKKIAGPPQGAGIVVQTNQAESIELGFGSITATCSRPRRLGMGAMLNDLTAA